MRPQHLPAFPCLILLPSLSFHKCLFQEVSLIDVLHTNLYRSICNDCIHFKFSLNFNLRLIYIYIFLNAFKCKSNSTLFCEYLWPDIKHLFPDVLDFPAPLPLRMLCLITSQSCQSTSHSGLKAELKHTLLQGTFLAPMRGNKVLGLSEQLDPVCFGK